MREPAAIHARSALLAQGWARDVRLVLADGVIASIEAGVAPQPDDAQAACLIPGLGNLHSHAFQRAMAGLGERRGQGDDSFWTWREAMYRFVGRIDPDALGAIAALAYAEMLESGFTRVGEFHYLHHDIGGVGFADPAQMGAAIAAAADQTGIGLTLLPVFYAHAGFGGRAPEAAQARFITDPDTFAVLHDASRAAIAGLPDAVLGLAPHSLRAVTPPELARLVQLAGNAPVHIHIAEQEKEVADCLAWSGARPVQWLLDNAPVAANWCLVHATHVTGAEARGIAASGAVAGLCPVTEANLGDGIFPADGFLEAGGHFGVGSDSNVLIDALEELRWLEYGQRLAVRRRNRFARSAGASTGEDLFLAAGAGGARALGVSFGIVVGESADLVGIDLAHPGMIGRDEGAILDALIFAAGRDAVQDVWRRGRHVVREGRHVQREAIVKDFARTIDRLTA